MYCYTTTMKYIIILSCVIDYLIEISLKYLKCYVYELKYFKRMLYLYVLFLPYLQITKQIIDLEFLILYVQLKCLIKFIHYQICRF